MDARDRGPAPGARPRSDRSPWRRSLFGTVQGIYRRVLVLPIARLDDGADRGLDPRARRRGPDVHDLLGGVSFSAIGLWIGTAISPQQIGLMFSVLIAPMIFFRLRVLSLDGSGPWRRSQIRSCW